MNKKLNVALVGLGFGAAFAEIWRDHPDVETLGIYDPDPQVAREVAEHLGSCRIYDSFEAILEDGTVDAVHLVSPIPCHAEQTVRVLDAGKHCACTVPMATTLEELQAITDAVRRSGKNYMMMETTLYTYQMFYVRELLKTGVLGKVQFLRGSHYQNMANWPDYWMGLPPFWYGTHAIAPMRDAAGSRICKVTGFGSGTMDESLVQRYGNPYPVECAVFEFENGLRGEATRSLFETARAYLEGFYVYGEKGCFEWGFLDNSRPYLSLGPKEDGTERGVEPTVEELELPNYHHSLPEAIQRYTVGDNFDPTRPQDSLKTGSGGGHHGSHPHLVHEFVRSILEERKPAIDEVLGANITAAGICAHLSAMAGGAPVTVPEF